MYFVENKPGVFEVIDSLLRLKRIKSYYVVLKMASLLIYIQMVSN